MDLAPLIFVVLLGHEVAALRLLRKIVPPYPLRGEDALLECSYDLELNKLYSITWYKDNEEFYRYQPRGEPNKHSHRIEGVKVDHRHSDHEKVLLQDVSLQTSGKYKCEISAEGPNFPSISAEASMEVIVLPREAPSITGEEKVYATGDVLALNCTSDKSHPAANLKWFVNGALVHADSEMQFEYQGLYSTISSLRLQLEPNHVAGDKINVRCESTVRSGAKNQEPMVDTRNTEVFVQGHASVTIPSACLLLAAVVLQRLLPLLPL
ncbi:hypothetical protein KM043_011508 [Ampulex compressa]|nr:hypothetical protein KM043_011508 [Ampulex compressa]